MVLLHYRSRYSQKLLLLNSRFAKYQKIKKFLGRFYVKKYFYYLFDDYLTNSLIPTTDSSPRSLPLFFLTSFTSSNSPIRTCGVPSTTFNHPPSDERIFASTPRDHHVYTSTCFYVVEISITESPVFPLPNKKISTPHVHCNCFSWAFNFPTRAFSLSTVQSSLPGSFPLMQLLHPKNFSRTMQAHIYWLS